MAARITGTIYHFTVSAKGHTVIGPGSMPKRVGPTPVPLCGRSWPTHRLTRQRQRVTCQRCRQHLEGATRHLTEEARSA